MNEQQQQQEQEQEFEQELDDWIDEALKRGEGFQSEEERQAYLDSLGDPLKHPLFAQSTEDLKDHPLAEAFRQLREEDKSLVELCLMYKDEGNDFMKKKVNSTSNRVKETIKNMNEAYDRYSHAITLLQQAKIAKLNGKEDPKDIEIDLNALHSIILSNRAQASLNIKNYRYCIHDCTQSIKHNPSNIKSYFKKAKALFLLRKYKDAMICCEQGLLLDTSNTDLIALTMDITKEMTALNEKEYQFELSLTEKLKKWNIVWDIICTKLNGKLGYPLHPTNPFSIIQSEYYPKYDIENKDNIRIPLLFLYPEYGEHDIVQETCLNDLLAEQLAIMFPEPEDDGGSSNHNSSNNSTYATWDRNREYHVSKLIVYLPLGLCPAINTKQQWNQCYHELCAMENQKLSKSQLKQLTISIHSDGNNHGETTAEEGENVNPSIQAIYSERISSHEKQAKLLKNTVLEVHLGCSIETIIRTNGCILGGGLLTMIVFVRGNDSHKQYLAIQNNLDTVFKTLYPTGQIQ